jgi:PadR family transcriptional regulator, regulatory protein PadR
MYQLSKRDEEILLTIWELKKDAYLVEIRKQISEVTGKDLTIGAIHIPLTKLEKAGIIESQFGEATPKRGGRRKRIYKITQIGLEVLKEYKKKKDTLWSSFNKAFSN